MTTFLAIYRGRTISESQMVAVTTDTDLVALVATKILRRSRTSSAKDPALKAIAKGRRAALRLIKGKAK